MTKQHSWTGVAKAVTLGLALAVASQTDAYTITQITDNATSDWAPAISGNNVAWSGYSNDGNDLEIYFTTVPEPTMLSLLAAGTLLACLKRRRCH